MLISGAIGRQPKQLSLILTCLSGSAVLLFLIPSLWGDYARILLFTILLYVIMAVSYDVVGGLLGYLYLGHGLFFGLGAYITALALQHSQPLPLALLLAGCLTLPVAAILSFPLFRLHGAVFALATLGLLFLGGQLASNLAGFTGGAAIVTTLHLPAHTVTLHLTPHYSLDHSRIHQVGVVTQIRRQQQSALHAVDAPPFPETVGHGKQYQRQSRHDRPVTVQYYPLHP